MPKPRKVYIVSVACFDYNDEIYTVEGHEVDRVFSNKKAAVAYQQQQNRQFLLDMDDFGYYCYDIHQLFRNVSAIGHLLEYDRGNPYRVKASITTEEMDQILHKMHFDPYCLAEAEVMTK